MTIQGFVKNFDGITLTIVAPFTDSYFLQDKAVHSCEVRLDDGRSISADQRKKIYATLKEISEWSGHLPEFVKEIMKFDYISKTGADYFSLSDCSMTTANQYLEHIIAFAIEWGVPCQDSLLDRSPDIERYVYACLLNKKCAICGKPTELHHVDAVGMGRNRKEIIHEGMTALPLCTGHHKKAHTIGKETFNEKYKIYGIKMTKELCQVYKLRGV